MAAGYPLIKTLCTNTKKEQFCSEPSSGPCQAVPIDRIPRCPAKTHTQIGVTTELFDSPDEKPCIAGDRKAELHDRLKPLEYWALQAPRSGVLAPCIRIASGRGIGNHLCQ